MGGLFLIISFILSEKYFSFSFLSVIEGGITINLENDVKFFDCISALN